MLQLCGDKCKIGLSKSYREIKMREVYRKIAKKYGVSVKEVKRDMQEALTMAYKNAPKDETGENQARVPRAGDVPTPEEFIRYAVEKIEKEK